MIYCLIMAGGVGERFWPRSRKLSPKQLLKITTKECLLAETIRRIESLIPLSQIKIITNEEQSKLILDEIHFLNNDNIIIEPFGMNTAPCIALASSWISDAKPDDVMLVLPADHIIHDKDSFCNQIRSAEKFCIQNQCLLTIGIQPTEPSTGYGYIKLDAEVSDDYFKVKCFVEKPDIDTAEKYVSSHQYLWNSGMFLWTFQTIRNEFKKYVPGLFQGMQNILISENKKESALKMFNTTEKISIDYAILEKSDNVFVTPSQFDWDDLGSWDAYERHAPKSELENISEGKTSLIESHGNIVLSKDKLIAMIGIDNLIIVESDDAIMICPKNRAQDVKKIVQNLKNEYKEQYL